MKGILPVPCRVVGYALLVLSVFAPMLMYVAGMVNDGNLLYVKSGMKLLVWLSLFMVFLARAKDEDGAVVGIRAKAMGYALYIWGIYYVVMLVKGALEANVQSADNSVGIAYMVINVLCFEFLMQKRRMEKLFKKK